MMSTRASKIDVDGFRQVVGNRKMALGEWGVPIRAMVAIFLILTSAYAEATPERGGQLRILLRYDDFSRNSNAVLESHLLTGLQHLDAPLLVGVIPFPGMAYPELSIAPHALQADLGPDKLALLRKSIDAGDLEIALHGFNHRPNFLINGQESEFAGLGLERQQQLLALGRTALEQAINVPVRVFVPPYNTFDGNTLRAMEQTGFTVLSAGGTPPKGGLSLAYFPGTVYPQQMRAAIEAALQHKTGTGLIVVVMHPYDFAESSVPVPAFRHLRTKVDVAKLLDSIRWAKSQPGVRFVSVSSELAERSDLSAARVISNFQLHNSIVRTHALLPGMLASPSQEKVLLPTETARAMLRKENLMAISIFVAIGMAAFASSMLLNGLPSIGQMRGVQRKLLVAMLTALIFDGLIQGFYFLKVALLLSGLVWYAGTYLRRIPTPSVRPVVSPVPS
jgi:predicted deacetylase